MGDTDEVKPEPLPVPEPVAAPVDEGKAFVLRLRALTPRAWVTWAIISANVIVYGVTVALGADWMKPDAQTLIKLGGDYAPLAQGGEWWRLITATFLHIGALHIAMNMLVFAQIGHFVERLLGSTTFLALYLLCGIFGSLASVAWNPYVVSVGASGAIFGCYGIFIGFLLRSRGSIPPAVLNKLLRGALVFIGFNVIYGLQPGIDMAGHFGGLASGFVFGLAVAAPLSSEAAAGRLRRGAIVAGFGAIAAVAIALALPKPVDVDAEIKVASQVENEINDTLRHAAADYSAKKIDDAGYVALLRKEILPKWQAARKRLGAVRAPKGRPGQVLAALIAYMDARAEAFELFAQAGETNDPEKTERAAQMTKDAEAKLRESLK